MTKTETDQIKFRSMAAVALFTFFLLGACNQNNHTESHEDQLAEADIHPQEDLHTLRDDLEEDQVLITGRQMQTVDITLGRLSHVSLSGLVKTFGTVTLPPSYEASVSPFIGGVVRNISVIEGDHVVRGQTLARIEHPDIVDLQKDYLEMQSRHEYLEIEYKRQESLYADSINAARTFQKIRSEYQTNLTRMRSLEKKLELIDIHPDRISTDGIQKSYPLVAPISGYVSSVMVNTGAHISSQQELIRVTNNEKAHIDLEVYEKDIMKVEEGQHVTFTLANSGSSVPMEGFVLKKSSRFNPDTRTAVVHVAIDQMNHTLLPGMSVIAHIHTGGTMQDALPEEALVSDQGIEYVFQLASTGSLEDLHEHEHTEGSEKYYIFQRMEVRKGITDGGFSGIVFDSAVPDTVRFAVSNPQALLAEMKKDLSGHPHAH